MRIHGKKIKINSARSTIKSKRHLTTKYTRIGGRRIMEGTLIQPAREDLSCLRNIKMLIQQSMKEKGLTPEEAIKSIGVKRYEK